MNIWFIKYNRILGTKQYESSKSHDILVIHPDPVQNMLLTFCEITINNIIIFDLIPTNIYGLLTL
jgi:hypothetical protein